MTRVAAIQMTSGRDVAANLDAASAMLAEASGMGAQLLVLPENFAFLAADDTERLAAAERWGAGAVQAFLREQARALGAWLVGGTIALWEDAEGAGSRRARAASLLVDPRGEIRARYDKIHLFDVGLPGSGERYRESASTSPGTEVVSAETDVGRIGMAVCYDLRFPALFDRLGVLGAEILALPAAFTVPTGEAHWRVLVRARAIETLAYVVAAAQCGEHAGGRLTYGHSIIVDPWGAVVAERAAGPGVVMADLDMMRLQRLRERFPALQHRRTL